MLPNFKTTLLELVISCRSLKDEEHPTINPICVLQTIPFGRSEFEEYAQTETFSNETDPVFREKIEITYFFERLQKIQVSIYNVSKRRKHSRSDKCLGSTEFTLAELVQASGLGKEKEIGPDSFVRLEARHPSDMRTVIRLKFGAKDLDDHDVFSKSDPFIRIYRKLNNYKSYRKLYESEVIMNNLNPIWNEFEICSRDFTHGSSDNEIKIECWDFDSADSADFIGECSTTVQQLLDGPENNDYKLINAKYKKKRNYADSGTIYLISVKTDEEATFYEYITSGLKITFGVAVDFTASNGSPRSKTSLHYKNPATNHNPYTIALTAVGNIISDYDYDKRFACYGFGAKPSKSEAVSDCFFLNGSTENPFVDGVSEILEAYCGAVDRVVLFGPTNLSPIIEHYIKLAEKVVNDPTYFILLIVTDGEITDKTNTISSIVKASFLPISIIIVGVGYGPFTSLEILNDRNKLLKDFSKREAMRDNVQFIALKDFCKDISAEKISKEENAFSNWLFENQSKIANKVLADLPYQITIFYKFCNNLMPSRIAEIVNEHITEDCPRRRLTTLRIQGRRASASPTSAL